MLVQGKNVRAFENGLQQSCARQHAIACGSGTAALELALAALEIPRGAHVLCPNLSWPSPAHAIVRAGLVPVLVDVEESTWNVSASRMKEARTNETKAAIVIDQFGSPAAHAELAEALDGLPIIVDAACSLGAMLHDKPAPSFGTISCLSFHPRKVITTGEGGACLTDDPALAERLAILRNHGVSGPGEFLLAGGNHRMTEIEAAMGIVQLSRLDEIVRRRRALAQRYRAAIGDLGMQSTAAGAESNWQTFGVLLQGEGPSAERDAVVAALRAKEVEAGRLSYALHRLGSLQGFVGGPFPTSERIEDRGFALPLHPLMTEEEQERVITALDAALDEVGVKR